MRLHFCKNKNKNTRYTKSTVVRTVYNTNIVQYELSEGAYLLRLRAGCRLDPGTRRIERGQWRQRAVMAEIRRRIDHRHHEFEISSAHSHRKSLVPYPAKKKTRTMPYGVVRSAGLGYQKQ